MIRKDKIFGPNGVRFGGVPLYSDINHYSSTKNARASMVVYEL